MSSSIVSEDNTLTSTCCFLVGQSEDRVTENKFLLSQSSTVFEAMLCGELQEKRNIEVPDIELDAFQTMLKFINGEEVSFSSMDHASRVCYAADKYDLPGLKRQCAEYMYPCTIDDIWLALNCGAMYNIDLLKNVAMQFVRENTYKVLRSYQFLSLTRPALKVIVQEDCLNIKSEVELFEAVMSWAKHQCYNQGKTYECKNIRDVVGDVINHIRFLTMSKTEVINNGKMILATDEMKSVLKCLNKESDMQLLNSLCCNTEKRKGNKLKPPTAIVYTVNFKGDHEKHIVASNDINSLSLSPPESTHITLYSVTVPTRSSIHEMHDSMYFEDVVLDLKNCNGEVIAYGNFSGRVEYDSEIRIPLFTPDGKFPMILSDNTTLHISFKSKETHYYTLRKCNFLSVFPNIKNIFSYVIGVEYSFNRSPYRPGPRVFSPHNDESEEDWHDDGW